MADSKCICEPGWQAKDASGVLSGAFIDLFLEETTTDLTGYSDADQENALSNPVVCNSAGFPSSDGNTPVTVWVGTQNYRMRLRRADGTTVWDFDNQPGATATTASQNRKYIGEAFFYVFGTPPDSNCLPMNGKTIGSAASGATARASDSQDTATTFAGLWNTFTDNTLYPIQDSAGSPTTRGDTAAADFAANKRFPLLDVCGRALIGADNMAGIASKNRLTGLSLGVDGDIPGATGGAEGDTLAIAKLPVIDMDTYKTDPTHLHTAPDAAVKQGAPDAAGDTSLWRSGTIATNTSAASTGITFAPFGSGEAHNNVQPSIILPLVLIYAGAP